jgi:glycosyltransferase involved in cell wall biosynthesis
MRDADRRTHIWVIIDLYYPNFSGAAIQTHQVLKELTRRGFSATVLASGDRLAWTLRGKEVHRDGITISYLRTIPCRDWSFLHRFQLLRRVVSYLMGLLHSLSMAVLCAFTLWRRGRAGDIIRFESVHEFSLLPICIARWHGMHPVIGLTLLGSDDPASIVNRAKRGRVIEYLRLIAFRRAEAIVTTSSALTSSCLTAKVEPDRIVRISCGVNACRFQPASRDQRMDLRRKLGLDVNQRYIVFVGAAIARKGIDVLVAAYLQVHQQFGDVGLLVVGPCDRKDGAFGNLSQERTLANKLRDELEAAGCSSYVHWIGTADNVRDYMRAADIFCLPTRREGFGIVIIEAMAAGLPVVVARLEGVTTDIIQSDAEGLLIDGHNADDYAQALLRLLRDSVVTKAMGSAARARVVAEFRLGDTVERYAELYRRLCR